MRLLSQYDYRTYQLGLRFFACWVFVSPVLLVIDAPFGRFSLDADSLSGSIVIRLWNSLAINGTFAWIAMELPSPLSLLYAFSRQHEDAPLLSTSMNPYSFLRLLFLTHYVNRAVISPLRTPSRAKSHVIVFLAATCFSLLNGSLMGTWLGAGSRAGWISWSNVPLSFYAGLAMFGLGLGGNIWHDEVLLQIRKPKKGQPEETKPRYAIPHGGLYSLVSFPNYLCEWFEWAGFALAANSIITPVQESLSLGPLFGIHFSPPVLFTLVEVAVMLPRAIRGHKWYHNKFEDYPKDRKAAIPFLL